MKQPEALLEESKIGSLPALFFPQGGNKRHAILTRVRGISGPETLLRVLFIHIANGCSTGEASVRAQQAGLGQLNKSAVYKRLRSAEEWLRWMAEQMRASLGIAPPQVHRRVRAVGVSLSLPETSCWVIADILRRSESGT